MNAQGAREGSIIGSRIRDRRPERRGHVSRCQDSLGLFVKTVRCVSYA